MRGLTGTSLPSTSAAASMAPPPAWAAPRSRPKGGAFTTATTTTTQIWRRRKSSSTTTTMSLSSSSSSSGGGGNSNPPPHNGGGGIGGSGSGGGGRRKKRPGLFEVLVETPPPRSLGLHDLPPDTHNGDRIEIDERAYVVRRLVLRYRLEKGRYVRATQAVEVASQGRFLVDQFLNQLVDK